MRENQVDIIEWATCKASNFSCCCLIFSASSFCFSSDDSFSFLRTPHGIFCFCSGASHLKTQWYTYVPQWNTALTSSANLIYIGKLQHSLCTCPACCQGSWDTPNCLDSAYPQHPSGMAMFSTLNICLKMKSAEYECVVTLNATVHC